MEMTALTCSRLTDWMTNLYFHLNPTKDSKLFEALKAQELNSRYLATPPEPSGLGNCERPSRKSEVHSTVNFVSVVSLSFSADCLQDSSERWRSITVKLEVVPIQIIRSHSFMRVHPY